MNGKIFGIPLILILLVIFIAAVVDVPMYLFHKAEMGQRVMVRCVAPDVTPTVTPIPTVVTTVSPTPKAMLPVRSNTSTKSGEVK